ncbi:hypothetical protein K431DRAFT_315128 [Polychaeton citri CBS 116435]|uniref:Dystroglycan-type cadherin-like domain-containing protein n=1 Tax=Polychaeton citri CBS 116435 TaxID=1314669 RepID=A0A9P4Q4K9_9PEZI|nr:hypothetical protein K431DRAFT_315128 [Polychaeton citri CBS 116435]
MGKKMLVISATISLLQLHSTIAAATPQVAFPFNSQLPTVPRANKPYSFEISPTTFSPSAANLTYSLSDEPSWLTLDSATRRLSGTPTDIDIGPINFTLSAADDDGSIAQMQCTLVVSADPPPQLSGDISRQLAESVNLSSSNPAIVTLLPSTPFRFVFQHNSFIDIVQRKLHYYATLADHSPLPSWLRFDASFGGLVFSGTAQPLAAYPQSFNISLISSDVAGFAATSAYFTIVIGAQQLVFVPDQQDISVESGVEVNVASLSQGLYLNDMLLPLNSLRNASASLPDWLHFDAATLTITGQAPDNVGDANGTVKVVDEMGDRATVTLRFSSENTALIQGSVGTLKAYIGEVFEYRIPHSVVDATHTRLSMDLGPAASWLDFNALSAELKGTVPDSTSPTVITATLTADAPGVPSQTQRFAINVQTGFSTASSSSSATDLASRTTASNTSTSSSEPSGATRSHNGLGRGAIAAVVVASIAAALVLVALFVYCCKRRRQRQESWLHFLTSATPPQTTLTRCDISGPVQQPGAGIVVQTELQRDVEKAPNSPKSISGSVSTDMTETERAPQLAFKVPRHSARGSKWNARLSRISQVSSIGDGEEALRSNSEIPEWGHEADVVNRITHHSFSLPAEMARASRHISRGSAQRQSVQRVRNKKRSSYGIERDDSLRRRSVLTEGSKNYRHKRGRSSLGLAATMDRSSFTSSSTRGTSVLSTRPSDFPRPPSEAFYPDQSSVPGLSGLDFDKRRSIRLVDRSGSIRDTRSMAEKRQSFIRNRASTSLQSPLFAHGSRVPSGRKTSSSRTLSQYEESSGHSRTNTAEGHLRGFSESSSALEPPPRNPRRLSAKVKSTFGPNFPRTITETTLGATDEVALTERTSSSSGFYTTSSSASLDGLAAEMALPRHQRSWVLPGEASPTPPPRAVLPRADPDSGNPRPGPLTARERLKKRLNRDSKGQLCDYSSSPLSSPVVVAVQNDEQLKRKKYQARSSSRTRNRLSEPLGLVSTDSIAQARGVRMRLLRATSARRPISIDVSERLSSMKAEHETETQAGSEVWEAMEGESVKSEAPRSLKRRSHQNASLARTSSSGPAFI